MGKRHKRHLHKKIKAPQFHDPVVENSVTNKEIINNSISTQPENEGVALTRHPVRQELTKVGLTFSLLLVLLIGVTILNNKTTLLDTFSTKLATLFHIN